MLQTAQKRRSNGLGLGTDFQGSVSFRLNEQVDSSQCQFFLLPPKEHAAQGAAHNIHLICSDVLQRKLDGNEYFIFTMVPIIVPGCWCCQ